MAREEKDRKEVRKPSRKKRVPLGVHRSKLTIEGFRIPPDKVARWIVDHPGRIAMAEQAGYAFVDDPNIVVGEGAENQRDFLSTKVNRIVGTKENGMPLRAFLMMIDKDLYEEDQVAKQKEIDKIDEAIRGGNIQGQVGVDGRYIPKGGISYET